MSEPVPINGHDNPELDNLELDDLELDGRVAVVTGTARGIGRATAVTLARAGASLAVCDKLGDEQMTLVDELGALGVATTSAVIDVRDAEAVADFLADVARVFGRVDVLVNNAGGGFHSSFLDVSMKGQAALVDENFTQVTHLLRGAVPLMTDGGSIVNVTSIEAHRAGPGFAIYSAMKAAVASLTKTLALELADRRIRVNAVAPDMIPTEGDSELVAAAAALGEGSVYAQPSLEGGTVWDVANVVHFLASDMSRFVTGSTIHVDGGTYAASGWRRGDEPGKWLL